MFSVLEFMCLDSLFYFFLILIVTSFFTVLLLSAVQQSESVIYIHSFLDSFPIYVITKN